MTPKPIITTAASQGVKLSIAGGSYRIVISGAQTDGSFAVIEMTVPPGAGPNPHAHPDFEESFYVLEGEVVFQSELGSYSAQKGAFINIPKGGMVHEFKNRTELPAVLLCTVIPAGLEAFFEEVSQLEPSEIKEKIQAISEKYGQLLYAADYFDGVR